MKTLIHVWTHTFNIDQNHLNKYNHLHENDFYFGLGDLLRSTIKLFYLSKQMNCNLYIDLQLHPISKFLDIPFNPFAQQVLMNKDNIDYVCYGAIEDYINNHNQNEIMYILTNDFYDGEVGLDVQEFIKHILTPNVEFNKIINNTIKSIPFSNYNILHFRLGDNYFFNKVEEDYKKYTDIIKNIKQDNDILITDSDNFKKHIFLEENIFVLNTFICHLGVETDEDKIRDTLLEFFIITHAECIKTFSSIHKVSGFVKWISAIYNIKLVSYN